MSVTTEPLSSQQPPRKKQRGRETAADMIRSLAPLLLIVVVLAYLARPTSGDSKAIRVVDTSGAVAEFRQAVPGAPAPTGLPADWKATVATVDPTGLRLGWVAPGEQYAEFAASSQPEAAFLPGLTGDATEVGTFTVDGVPWRQFRDDAEHTSLVRTVGGATVLVGGVRETSSLDQLRVLAAAVR